MITVVKLQNDFDEAF